MFAGTGQFPDSQARIVHDGRVVPFEAIRNGDEVPAFFRDVSIARPVLIVSLALQTQVALRRAGMSAGQALYVEGGFRRNQSYNNLLAALHPESAVSRTSMKEATAFGAAILGKLAVEKLEPQDVRDFFDIEFNPVDRFPIEGLEDYSREFHRLLEG
jgi:sugar (pentulose or hexulose) kinase